MRPKLDFGIEAIRVISTLRPRLDQTLVLIGKCEIEARR